MISIANQEFTRLRRALVSADSPAGWDVSI